MRDALVPRGLDVAELGVRSPITSVERVNDEDARGIPAGWRWKCCTAGCKAGEFGLSSFDAAALSLQRLSHVCASEVVGGSSDR